jgi:hypothetical protein
MHNLVEKFTPADEATKADEGLVAIEYVVGAGLVAAGVGVVWATDMWQNAQDALNAIVF